MVTDRLFSQKVDPWLLRGNPQVTELLNGLRGSFEVTWAAERIAYGTKMLCFILKPHDIIKETFGFEREIALFVSRFPFVEPRTFQAIDQFCHESPLHERVDPSVVILNSPDNRMLEKINNQQSEYPQSRMIVALSDAILSKAVDDRWAINNGISEVLFIRDLFNYKLPVQPSQYFYGREQVISTLVDGVRKCQNSGLFGLRKTGKTSILLRVLDILHHDRTTYQVFIDCKKRYIRKLTCDGLIARLVKQIDQIFKSNISAQLEKGIDATEVLENAIRKIPNGRRLCIVFDEIEYITPLSPTDLQWKEEFVDFWQAVWAIQSETQKLCFIICGVNPSICEIDRFADAKGGGSVQNPMFGIVNVQYLHGLGRNALADMMHFFGKRMGLRFSEEAIQYVFDRFGGHPLLSRLACSFYHETLLARSERRPIEISRAIEERMEAECYAEISAYCEHVVSEVREFYPDEFELLSLAARGEAEQFLDRARSGRGLAHIRNYGLLEQVDAGKPIVLIPVLRQYLQEQFKRESGERHFRVMLQFEARPSWLERKKRSLDEDICILNEELRATGMYDLFPGGSLRKISDLLRLDVVQTQSDLTNFLVVINRIFVENIERHLKDSGRKLFVDVKSDFPHLFEALMRIKLYRHYSGHIELDDSWLQRFKSYVANDFGDLGESVFVECPFLVQQVVLEEMHVGLQYEIARY
ncbi:ATP-binding protein [Sphingorhabdus contaminans]|uniref:ATP-binding protein n=1 Tax=Sphingorhabdus contaminans TaxID=1343899 RepID=A0A553WH67_9SPHN|nr:ATP-binding protein [Sphingorhabdus contaminans]TSB04030.1 ATP-binding protein [Sphingorhabdus contaminans]